MKGRIEESHKAMPVDFVTYNWFAMPNGESYKFFVKGEEADHTMNINKKVISINIIDRNLAEISFEGGGFVAIKNLNTYGRISTDGETRDDQD